MRSLVREHLLASKMKVLVIDDDYWTRRITVAALVHAGVATIEAATGKEGFDLAIRERPTCILLDFFLPDCEGTEILDELRSLESEPIPVIFVTSLLDETQRLKLIELGAAAVIAKPVDLLALPCAIEKIVGKTAND